MPTIDTYVTVNVDLDQFDTDDLVKELERRGNAGSVSDISLELITKIYHRRRLGQDYQRELDSLIDRTIGRLV